MAIDETLAARLRDAAGDLSGLRETRMMGSLCLMLDGHMLGGTHRDKETGEGRFLFRVGKENAQAVEARPEARRMVMGGRTMSGFYYVSEADCTDAILAGWMALACDFVRTLPPRRS